MTLTKRKKDILIHFKEPENEINIVKPMTSICREIFKPIKFGDYSIEYDKLADFIRPCFEDLQTDIGKQIASEHMKR